MSIASIGRGCHECGADLNTTEHRPRCRFGLPSVTDGLDRMTPQRCQAGVHADWAIDAEHSFRCPWCRISELSDEVERLKQHIADLDIRPKERSA